MSTNISRIGALKKIIEVKNLTFAYENEQNLFDNLSVKFYKNDFVSIIGPNGSGKSTLLNLIAGVLLPKKGEIVIINKNINMLKRKDIAKKISFLPQILPESIPFTVFDIVLMGRYPHKNIFEQYTEEDIERVNYYLKFLDLIELKAQLFQNLSGGEKRRVMLAQALTQETDIIFLDEPDAFLDINHKMELYSFLEKLNNELGKTVIVISHDLNLALKYSKRIMVLKKGKIVYDRYLKFYHKNFEFIDSNEINFDDKGEIGNIILEYF